MAFATLVAKFLHVLSVIIMVGGIIARQLVRSRIARSDDPGRMALAFQLADPLEQVMVRLGGLPVLVFGVINALLAGAPVFGFLQGSSQNWLLVSNLLIILVALLVPFVFLPRGRVFGAALEDAVQEGRVTPELRANLDDPVTRLAHTAEMAAIVLIVFLMVVKPF